MDFTKLSRGDLEDFLSRFGVDYTKASKSPDKLAEQLFDTLKSDPNVIFPLPIVDLYLATYYKGSKDKPYLSSQILNLTPDQVELFDQGFKFNSNLYDLDTNRNRILRILGYLDLIIQPEEILLQQDVIQQLCENLSFDELMKFRVSHSLTNLDCWVPVNDKDGKLIHIKGVNPESERIHLEVEKNGSIFTYMDAYYNDDRDGLAVLKSSGMKEPTLIEKIKDAIVNSEYGDIDFNRFITMINHIATEVKVRDSEENIIYDETGYPRDYDLNFEETNRYSVETWFGRQWEYADESPGSQINMIIKLKIPENEVHEVIRTFFPELDYQIIDDELIISLDEYHDSVDMYN